MTEKEINDYLVVAVKHNNLKKVKELVEKHKADVNTAWDYNAADYSDELYYKETNVLCEAIKKNNYEIAKYLLEKGALIVTNCCYFSREDKDDCLEIIINKGNVEFLELFLQHKKNSEQQFTNYGIHGLIEHIDVKIKRPFFSPFSGLTALNMVETILNNSTFDINYLDENKTILDKVTFEPIRQGLRKRGAKTYEELYEKGKTE